jgi:pimeloyl-ACP methyl ester carboxylesterase
MPHLTLMTGATAWHCFVDPEHEHAIDSALRHPNASTPAAVVDAAANAARNQPVILLLHANGFGAATYTPLARSLRAHLAATPSLARAPILAPDFPGQGDSSRAFPDALGRPLTAPRFAAWLLSVLEAQGLLPPVNEETQDKAATKQKQIFCFGHSGGAATALVAEALRPGTFSAIFAYEPVEAPPEVREAQARELLLSPIGNKGEPLARMARKRRAVFDSKEAARASLGSKPPFRELCAEALDLYVDTQMEPLAEGGGGGGGLGGGESGAPAAPSVPVRLKCAPEVEAEYFQAFSRPPHDWRYERVRCPVALACGGAVGGGLGEAGSGQKRQQQQQPGPHDALAAWAPLTAKALPRGEMTPPFARLGHLGPLEDPQAVGAAAAAFFARVAAAAAEGSVGGAGASVAAARSKL